MNMYVSTEVAEIINQTYLMAKNAGFEYVTPELLLYVICRNKVFVRAFQNCDGNVRKLDFQLKTWLEENMEQIPGEYEENEGDEKDAAGNEPEFSQGMEYVLSCAWESALGSEKSMVELPHLLHAMYRLPESYAVYFMQIQGV